MGGDVLNYLMLWLESTSMLRRSGAGNGCFRNSIAGGIEGVENKDAITWMVVWYRKRCVQQCKQQASTSPLSVTHCAILSGSATLAFGQVRLLTCSNTATIFARFKNYWDIAI